MAKLLAVLALLFVAAKGSYNTITVDSKGDYQIVDGIDQSGVVFAYYSDDVERIGWATLTLNTTTNTKYEDRSIAEAAGYLEGALTQMRIYQGYLSSIDQFANSTVPASLYEWIHQNLQFVQTSIQANKEDKFWINIDLLMAQLQGMTAGYMSVAPADQQLTIADLFLLSSGGDLGDIMAAIQAHATRGSAEHEVLKGFKPHHTQAPHWGSHCSVLVKPTSDLSELYAAHTTWSGFGGMLRTYKIYNLQFNQNPATAISSSFSSYPGTLTSIDDFYVLSSNMIVMETTNGVFNNSLYLLVTPQSLVSWMRVAVANRIAKSGQDWVTIFEQYNSGTYNNQWQVVDYNKFQPGKPIQNDTLWIVEQMPGYCESADVSFLLRDQGYFPSYNIPYFPDVFNRSGFNMAVEKYGYWFNYHQHPRAQIFAREQSKIENLNWMKYIMRFNEWQTDPISKGNSINGIASRGDLVNASDPSNPFLDLSAFGGIDSKIGSYQMTLDFQASAISGPTFQEQPYFRWTDAWASIVHVGQPEIFNFDWNLFTN